MHRAAAGGARRGGGERPARRSSRTLRAEHGSGRAGAAAPEVRGGDPLQRGRCRGGAIPPTEPLSAPKPTPAAPKRKTASASSPTGATTRLLIYATPSEYAIIEGMLRKIDIIPLQVLIEATIAEVTLNDKLQYGTQFFFRAGSCRRNARVLPPGDFPTTALSSRRRLSRISKAPNFILQGARRHNQAQRCCRRRR